MGPQIIWSAARLLHRLIHRHWAAETISETTGRACSDKLGTLLPIADLAHPLDTFPCDILLIICLHVPSLQDLSHLSLACRALTHPAQYVLFQRLPPLDPLYTVLAFHALLRKPYLARTVKSVKLKVCEADDLQGAKGYGLQPAAWLRLVWRAIRRMPNLQELELVMEWRTDRGAGLPRIWEVDNLLSSDLRLKRVHLDLPASDPIDFLVQQTALEELGLRMQRDQYGFDTAWVDWFARLTHADMPALKAFDAPGLWAVKQLLTGRPVKRLTICDWFVPENMPEVVPILLGAASQLRVLEISYLCIKPEVIQWFAENLTGLEELRLTVWAQLVDESVTDSLENPAVLQSMRHLRKLRKLTLDLAEKPSWDCRKLYAPAHLLGDACEALEEIEVSMDRHHTPFRCRRCKPEGSKEWGVWMIRSDTEKRLREFIPR